MEGNLGEAGGSFRVFLSPRPHCGEPVMVGDDLFGEWQVSLQQRLGGVFHSDARQPTHLT